ncbi:uncharacterized protein G2W53_024881 [Senna tora]|uniref:Uncharacterized protein n=1 Tax=Senna tora TaxID=362788 RepID=A0A834WDK2_9FABA|nr:uncharacterized protein G2W53_024880 [Senna tora]KAF7819426.1 uncharacterized protein G2W53_024881 [Senna tora]
MAYSGSSSRSCGIYDDEKVEGIGRKVDLRLQHSWKPLKNS